MKKINLKEKEILFFLQFKGGFWNWKFSSEEDFQETKNKIIQEKIIKKRNLKEMHIFEVHQTDFFLCLNGKGEIDREWTQEIVSLIEEQICPDAILVGDIIHFKVKGGGTLFETNDGELTLTDIVLNNARNGGKARIWLLKRIEVILRLPLED